MLTGAGVTAAWLLLFGLLASSARSLVWLLVFASCCAWAAALMLIRFGDRGVAVGIALSAGAGITIVGILVVARWATTGWFLW